MARKKKKETQEIYNPYFGKFEDESKMAKKPYWTWILAAPGLVLGIVVAIRTGEPFLGPVFGIIMGIGAGSLIDKHREKKQEQRDAQGK